MHCETFSSLPAGRDSNDKRRRDPLGVICLTSVQDKVSKIHRYTDGNIGSDMLALNADMHQGIVVSGLRDSHLVSCRIN